MKLAIAAALLATAACSTPQEPLPEPVSLPFHVSDYYSPDGFYGDGEFAPVRRGDPEYLVLEQSCAKRAPGAKGDCYTITYRPGPRRFAGIFWQYPHNNWGYSPGRQVEPGATRVRLQVRGERGGEAVSFGGGQRNTMNPYNDVFSLGEITPELTTSWAEHSIEFRGETYAGPSGVIGAFMIGLRAGNTDDPITLYIDDIRWE